MLIFNDEQRLRAGLRVSQNGAILFQSLSCLPPHLSMMLASLSIMLLSCCASH